jgi:hypothetical protein
MTMVFSVANVPVGIDLFSPITWFVAAVAAIVLALAVSTRRSNMRPRPIPAVIVERVEPPAPDAAAWSAAQTLFFTDPRAACRDADRLVAKLLRERSCGTGAAAVPAQSVIPLAGARAVLGRVDPSTKELRAAFTAFHGVFDAVLAAQPEPDR